MTEKKTMKKDFEKAPGQKKTCFAMNEMNDSL